MFDILDSDIVVMQELKIQRKDLRDDMVLIDGWDCYFSLPTHKKGYSGVGVYTRNSACAPLKAEEGLLGVLPSPCGTAYCDLPADQGIGGYPSASQIAAWGIDAAALDAEGRCLVLEFPAFVLFGVYSPANSNGLRDDFRYGFICALDRRIRNLIAAGKQVVLVGDLNVSRDELDSASAREDCRKAGISHEDYISTPNRRIFNQLLIGGEVVGERDEGREHGVLWDTTRAFHPGRTGMYTHWEQKINARPGNYGGRIDFILVSEGIQSWLKNADIQEGLLGSDHCPVFVDFHENVRINHHETPLIDITNPAGTFENSERKVEWRLQSAPAFSAKRMPEFDKRRSIKSMFAAPAVKPSQSNAEAETAETVQFNAVQTDPMSSEGNPASSRPSPSPIKRKASETHKEMGTKRPKADASPQSGKGQQSLKGFFRSAQDNHTLEKSALPKPQLPDSRTDKSTTAFTSSLPESNTTPTKSEQTSNLLGSLTPQPAPTDREDPTPSSPDDLPSPLPTSGDIQALISTHERTQRSWGALFAKPAPPLCDSHSEPCKSMQTKKKGSNQGRSFWMCARPLGPSGVKEHGTQWRCGTFIWCSEWKGG